MKTRFSYRKKQLKNNILKTVLKAKHKHPDILLGNLLPHRKNRPPGLSVQHPLDIAPLI